MIRKTMIAVITGRRFWRTDAAAGPDESEKTRHIRCWGKNKVAMNSLALLKERAETRNNRRKSLAEIYSAMSELRGAVKGVPPQSDSTKKIVDDAIPETARRLIAEARTLAGSLAVEHQDVQQLQKDLAKVRGIARARALVLIVIAIVLAPLAIMQLW